MLPIETDVQVAIHTDTLNESGFVERYPKRRLMAALFILITLRELVVVTHPILLKPAQNLMFCPPPPIQHAPTRSIR